MQGMMLLLIGSLSIAIVFLCVALKKQRKINAFLVKEASQHREVKENTSLKIIQKKIELSMLQSQINPHFLYNTLDSIRGQALLSNELELANMTEKLARFFRYAISSKGNLVRIEEELNNIRDYFYIQRYRFGDRIVLHIDYETTYILEHYIPKLTLQPLVENAIAHGLEEILTNGEVRIHIYKSDTKIYIKVSDNGMGMDYQSLVKLNNRLAKNQVEVSTRQKKHNWIALMNINARMRLWFGDAYCIYFRSLPGEGTTAELSIPLVDDFVREEYERKMTEDIIMR